MDLIVEISLQIILVSLSSAIPPGEDEVSPDAAPEDISPPNLDFSTSGLAVRPVRPSSFSSEPAFKVTFPQALHSGYRDLPGKLFPIGALQGASGGRIGRCGVYLDPRTEPKPCDNDISSLRKNFSSPARFSPKCYK